MRLNLLIFVNITPIIIIDQWCSPTVCTTMTLTLVTAFLWTFSRISVSVSEFHTVEVQPGEEVTLTCSNFTSFPSHIHWFKLGSGSNTSRISSMFSSDSQALPCDGFPNGKFNMESNNTTLFLKIKPANLSDSGLYFCGFYVGGNPIIASATYLKVQGFSDLLSVILGGLTTILIIIIISLLVKIQKLHTAYEGRHNPQNENPDSDALHYAAVSFHPKANSSRRPASERELESHVV
uniref:Ig-like domain-containing protein n=1 Tax=Monopterus albus TaxID=43700 RepID=A0A3Q3IHK8_MONAL